MSMLDKFAQKFLLRLNRRANFKHLFFAQSFRRNIPVSNFFAASGAVSRATGTGAGGTKEGAALFTPRAQP